MDEGAAVALQTRMADLCGHLNVLHAQLVDTVVEALDGELWQQWGIRSPEHWLAWQTGLSPARAKQLVDIARRSAPSCRRRSRRSLMASCRSIKSSPLPSTPTQRQRSVRVGQAATVSQLRSALSLHATSTTSTRSPSPYRWRLVGDPRDYLSTSFADAGRFAMHLNAPADQGAVISQAISEARDALFLPGRPMSPGSTPSSRSATAPSAPSPAHHDATGTGSTCISTPTTPVARPTPG